MRYFCLCLGNNPAQENNLNKEKKVQPTVPITKSLNEDLMQATFIVMVPDEVDEHGDITDASQVRKACHNFNKFCRTPNLFHMAETDTFEFAESYIAPVDFVLDERLVKQGTWLTTLQVTDCTLWQHIKDGNVCGVSIGALAKVEAVEAGEE